MKNGEIQLVFNTTEGKQALADSFELRRTALMMTDVLITQTTARWRGRWRWRPSPPPGAAHAG